MKNIWKKNLSNKKNYKNWFDDREFDCKLVILLILINSIFDTIIRYSIFTFLSF